MVKDKLHKKSNIDDIRRRVDSVIERSVAEIHGASKASFPMSTTNRDLEQVDYDASQKMGESMRRSQSPFRNKSP